MPFLCVREGPSLEDLVQILLFISLCLNWTVGVSGSAGDRDAEFKICVLACSRRVPACVPPAWSLYTCLEECQYECMHQRTTQRLAAGEPVFQYYGKWPFIRLLGAQELASVLFSIGNWLAHYYGFLKLVPYPSRWRSYYRFVSFIALNSWIWSIVFHYRDLPWTEKMDYFSAMASILTGTVVAILRTFKPSRRGTNVIFTGAILFFCLHIAYLSSGRFDYSYNIAACIIVGVLSYVTWFYWYLQEGRGRPYGWKIMAVVVAMSLAMSLECMDFAPLFFIVDAHALWHLATCFIIPVYYDFLMADSRFEANIN